MSTKRKLLVALAVFLVVIGGFATWLYRGNPAKHTLEELSGKDPLIAEPEPESFPSIRIADPVGWAAGEAPEAAKGLQVARFAEGLDHPRTMITLPNGDVIVALTNSPAREGGGLEGFVARVLFSEAGAGGASANELVLLRDADGDGKAEGRFTLRKANGLDSPSGLAWRDGTLYVANHDAVLAFPYQLGETSMAGAPKKVMDLPPGGNHWMRNLVLSKDGTRLYVAVGSASNIGEQGMEIEKGRAAIWEKDLRSNRFPRQFAQGLRNPNGLAWNPSSGELWTTVNERDMLGPDLIPDYLTNVPVGAHYGWPWLYWKKYDDDRVVAQPPDYIDDFVRKPEYALGPHVAALGLVFVEGGERLGPDYANGAFIARHGSWNRVPLSGYDVVFVRFDANGNPTGKPLPVLTGFLTGKGETRGRPTWVTFDKAGALLVTDDTAGIIWRVIAPAAAPAAAVKPVVTARMPPQRELSGDPATHFSAGFKKDENAGQ
jgi:YD repeat-containing protein